MLTMNWKKKVDGRWELKVSGNTTHEQNKKVENRNEKWNEWENFVCEMSVVDDKEGETHTKNWTVKNDATFFFSFTSLNWKVLCGQKVKFCVRWIDIENELTNENIIFHILVYVC